MSFVISEMISGHIAQVKAIEGKAWLSPWKTKDYADPISDCETICLTALENADVSESVIGFVLGKVVFAGERGEKQAEGEIFNIAVKSDFQNQGVGTALLSSLLRVFISRDVAKIWLEVRESNLSAIKFYEAHSFIRGYVRPNFYSKPTEDALVMKMETAKIEKACQRYKN